MRECNPEVRRWRDRSLFVCEACGVRTLDRGAFERRCASHRQPPAPTSSTGLLAPDGEPFPAPPSAEKPVVHDQPSPPADRPAATHDDPQPPSTTDHGGS